MLAEQVLDRGDGRIGALDQRMAVARVGDRGREHVGERHGAVVAQQQHPGIEHAGHAGREQPGAGHQVEAEARDNARCVAPAGAGPWPQITSTPPLRVSCRITGTSPPGPLRCGSTTCSVKAVATAASKALPPFSSIPMPTAVAIQWVEATTPKVPSISGRVVKGLGLTLLIDALRRFTGAASGDQAVYTGACGRPRAGAAGATRARAGLRCGRCRRPLPKEGGHFKGRTRFLAP